MADMQWDSLPRLLMMFCQEGLAHPFNAELGRFSVFLPISSSLTGRNRQASSNIHFQCKDG
jgi:hypothetical protein